MRDALAEATQCGELLGAAVYGSSIPYTAPFPAEHRAYMGALTRQQPQVRKTLEAHDLLLVLGADLAVQADVKETLRALLPLLKIDGQAAEQRLAELKGRNWSAQRDKARVDA